MVSWVVELSSLEVEVVGSCVEEEVVFGALRLVLHARTEEETEERGEEKNESEK